MSDLSSAYVILINDDNTMTTTQKRRIVQRSKLVDSLVFLANPEYNGYNMADFTVLLEYMAPVSHKYRTEILTLCEDSYNGRLIYTLPFDTNITAEAGEVKLMLSFIMVDLNEKGKAIQRTRKITETSIDVIPISAWSDVIPDCALSALDQRIIKMDAQIKAINETASIIADTKADNIAYDEAENSMQLMSGSQLIGDKVILGCASDEGGLPAVDFGTKENTYDDGSYEVVEF